MEVARYSLATGAPVVLAGDYNVMPTELDVYKPERWRGDALFRLLDLQRIGASHHAIAASRLTDRRTMPRAERVLAVGVGNVADVQTATAKRTSESVGLFFVARDNGCDRIGRG